MKYVLVTTDSTRRGVFAGQLESQDGDNVVLINAQNAIYWSAETHGVFGLASIGPQPGSRIGPPVSRLQLNGVTSISDLTQVAVEKWHQQPWG